MAYATKMMIIVTWQQYSAIGDMYYSSGWSMTKIFISNLLSIFALSLWSEKHKVIQNTWQKILSPLFLIIFGMDSIDWSQAQHKLGLELVFS